MIMRHGHHLCSNDVKSKKKRAAGKTKQKETRGESEAKSNLVKRQWLRKERQGTETKV
jgi:hypothetical protein